METSDSMKYLSLKTAAQLYGYTRDHLGLMIRQNKLKGKKLGSYYITTNEWVLEYIKDYADPSHSTAKNKLSNRFISDALSSKKEIEYVQKRENLFQKRTDSPKVIKGPSLLPAKEKSSASFIEAPKNWLQEEVLKELSRSQEDETLKIKEKFQPDAREKTFFPPFEPPYLILPMRKMENTEREQILNLLDRNEKEASSI
ncbi:MAG: hypothetical protein Q7K16_01885 [Candidatus Azambacteria bacterium]|nr:hypothetical protein [Candidatus Azambacteria bacterium]